MVSCQDAAIASQWPREPARWSDPGTGEVALGGGTQRMLEIEDGIRQAPATGPIRGRHRQQLPNAVPTGTLRAVSGTSETEHGGEHDHDHGGQREPGNDAVHWDERYAGTDRLWSAEPNRTVEGVVGPMRPGRAVDLGAGEGRHAVWLARRGWQVTAVDFSAVGLERGQGEGADVAERVEWVVADVRTWQPPAGTEYDLVLVVYLHVTEDVFGRARGWLAPGGALVVVGHALRNLTEGVGGPRDPRLLHTEEQLRAAASGLNVEQLTEVIRPTPQGDAIDLLLVAHRPT